MDKKIFKFDIDLSSLPQNGETRPFSIVADKDAEFILEIKNEDDYYYNFTTNAFQSSKSDLKGIVTSGKYNGNINFPVIGDDDQYDISLYALPGTSHADYKEVRFLDNTIDINSSEGSNSLMLKKVIYQYTDLTLTITPFSLSGNIEVASVTSPTITVSRGKSKPKTKFQAIFSVSTATKSYRILNQPNAQDVFSFVEPVVGSAPIALPDENIYPTRTAQANVNASAVENSDTVVMEENVSAAVFVGDKVTGFTAAADTVVVTVTNVSADTLTLSQNISVGAGVTLSFFSQKNFRWPLNNFVHLAANGTYIKDGTNITRISDYSTSTIINENTANETSIAKVSEQATDVVGNTPTVTNGVITAQAGNVIFADQQLLTFAGNTLKMGGYGLRELLRVYDYDATITGLTAELTTISTTTTAAVNNSTSVPIASRNGIIDSVSVCSGIGIDASVANPTVSSGAGSVSGAGTVVLSAVQTLEKGRTLTFTGAGQQVTITGFIEIAKAGTASQTLRFDVDKFISIT